jgi:hypothetical protein
MPLGQGIPKIMGPCKPGRLAILGTTPLGVALHLAHIFVFRLRVGSGHFTIWGKKFSFLEKFSPITKNKIKHLKKKGLWSFSVPKNEWGKKKKKEKSPDHIFGFHYVAKDKKMIKDFYFISRL